MQKAGPKKSAPTWSTTASTPAPASDLADPLPDVFISVVDDFVGTQFLGLRSLFGRTGGGDYAGSDDVLGHLDGSCANTGGSGKHQHRLPGLQLQPAHQHIPNRQVSRRHRSGLFEGCGAGNHVGVGCGNAEVLGIAAVEGAAEKLGTAAQVVLPGQASGTLLAGKPGIDYHMISLFQTSHTSPNRCHLA